MTDFRRSRSWQFRYRFLALGVWLLAVAISVVIVVGTPVRTDMGAFLPRSASMAQQALTDQASHGAASHIILLAIEGAPTPVLASLSKAMAARMRRDGSFIDIVNGDAHSFAGVRRFVWRNRYLLSDNITASRFTVAGLHAALENDLGLLGSGLGEAIQQSLPGDPTGVVMTLTRRLEGAAGPPSRDGAWFSPGGKQALLLVQTKAAGFDIDAQQRALQRIGSAFDAARAGIPAARMARLRETGPGVFAVRIRDITKKDVTRLALLATAGAVCLLLFAYRSPRVLLLGLLPVASGAIAAIAAVSLDFGFVHGVTLGFGVTLIGESLDYAIYLFTQTARGDTAHDTLTRIWPTLRLGALTSIVGFSAMLFSNFVGFAQLGLFSIVGLFVAAAVTRFVLPHLVPRGFFASGAGGLATPLLVIMRHRGRLRVAIGIIVLAGIVALAIHRGGYWDENLLDLSPLPPASQALDKTLRHDLGMSDLRYFAVFRAGGEQQALDESEILARRLRRLVVQHRLGGFDVPSMVLPSDQTQRARQAALPASALLHARFDQALAGLPFRPGVFDPFFRDVAASRTAPLITAASLPPALALRLHSMLVHQGRNWTVVAPLRGVTDPAAVAAAIPAAGLPGIQFVDLDHESGQLLHMFQREATMLAVIGSLAILAVLMVGLRSPARVARVVAPLVAAVIVTAAVLTLGGGKLSIFMVVGFLLIVAVGSNYCLFFERQTGDAGTQHRSVASIVLANLCTVAAYGLMGLSRIPVLHDIGMTVAMGAFLSLLFAAVLSTRGAATGPPNTSPDRDAAKP